MTQTMRTPLAAWLLCSLPAAVANAGFLPLDGLSFPAGDLGTPGESIGNQEDVDIAGGGSGFLVVWTDMRTSYNNLQGLDQTGRLRRPPRRWWRLARRDADRPQPGLPVRVYDIDEASVTVAFAIVIVVGKAELADVVTAGGTGGQIDDADRDDATRRSAQLSATFRDPDMGDEVAVAEIDGSHIGTGQGIAIVGLNVAGVGEECHRLDLGRGAHGEIEGAVDVAFEHAAGAQQRRTDRARGRQHDRRFEDPGDRLTLVVRHDRAGQHRQGEHYDHQGCRPSA